MKLYQTFIKRLFDFLAAAFGLLLIAPIFILLIILLAISNHGKPFFYQQRTGKNGKLFTIIKFKTMSDKTDKDGHLLPPGERITKTGDICRKYSLDEIPQLINILKGDMSLVGPRPLLPKYLARYNITQMRRHEVTPGISGWAQVNGRNAISWEQKFEFDVHYVDHQSFLLDVKVILKTIDKVINRKDITSADNTQMEEFMGSKS